ncbi:hypothetical protein MTR67_033937 [Solanum verrucosum]|uniref:Uncharacterized protein n=1 Tax=Solanum verrucosum TaxID=315347 RepID=A0AAF0U762_SOLVR|nr:hypothetical protein MTR67_033937 [Solanum verrucosum]
MNVLYHPGKANVVVDALTRLSISSVTHVEEENKVLDKDVHQLAHLTFCLTGTKKLRFSPKGEMVFFVTRVAYVFQMWVKVEHLRPGGVTQNIFIPMWKWEVINLDFITGLPHTRRQHHSIWVIVDRVTMSAHFLVAKITFLS